MEQRPGLVGIARTIWERVWQFRRETKGTYPIPDRIWAARFAVTESGETVDAVIRAEPQFKRNNAKVVGRESELADTAFMLATAIGETIPSNLFEKASVALHTLGYPSDMDVLPLLVGRALWAVKDGQSTWQMEAAVALLVVVDLMDDPIPSVDDTLERLKAKWGGAANDAPGTPSPSSPAAAGHSDVRIVPPGTDGAVDVTPLAVATFEYMVGLQRAKGIAKYGAPLTDKTAFPAWAYIWQEFADLGVYLTRLNLDYDKVVAERDELRAQLDGEQDMEKLRRTADALAGRLAEADRAAETWRARWFGLYWRNVRGGLPEGVSTLETVRGADAKIVRLGQDADKYAGDVTFVPLEYYAGIDFIPAKGEIGYHGRMNARIIYRRSDTGIAIGRGETLRLPQALSRSGFMESTGLYIGWGVLATIILFVVAVGVFCYQLGKTRGAKALMEVLIPAVGVAVAGSVMAMQQYFDAACEACCAQDEEDGDDFGDGANDDLDGGDGIRWEELTGEAPA